VHAEVLNAAKNLFEAQPRSGPFDNFGDVVTVALARFVAEYERVYNNDQPYPQRPEDKLRSGRRVR
jgi:hypothetical protein